MSTSAQSPPANPALVMRSIIQRIATGPELSKDISREEAQDGMRYILKGNADPVQAGIFLIALRMKRETDDEIKGILDALLEMTDTTTAPVDEVLIIADPYDGFLRMLPASPFLPALLAACGVQSVSHGVERMGPKFGVTHRQVLKAAGIPVDLSPGQAAARLDASGPGWAYVDQKNFCPGLYALADLRTKIVKRPVLTTVEIALCPVRGRHKTHLITGYVHKPYPPIYAMLARHADFDSALIVRGVEGGIVPSLQKTGRIFYYHDHGEEQYTDIDPADLAINQPVRTTPIPEHVKIAANTRDQIHAQSRDTSALAEASVQTGKDALTGKPGPTREALVFTASICLWHLRRHQSVQTAADEVRRILDSGAALERLT